MGDWQASAPVYVTRKTADGAIAYYSLPLWASLLALTLIWLNVIVWSVIGLVAAVGYFA